MNVTPPSSFAISQSADPLGGSDNLIQHLWDQFVLLYLKPKIEDMEAQGKPTVDLETAKKKTPATVFLNWAFEYLTNNRVTESFYVEANHGVRLTNGASVVICPGGGEQRGTMQDSVAIAITEGLDRPGNPQMQSGNTLRI